MNWDSSSRAATLLRIQPARLPELLARPGDLALIVATTIFLAVAMSIVTWPLLLSLFSITRDYELVRLTWIPFVETASSRITWTAFFNSSLVAAGAAAVALALGTWTSAWLRRGSLILIVALILLYGIDPVYRGLLYRTTLLELADRVLTTRFSGTLERCQDFAAPILTLGVQNMPLAAVALLTRNAYATRSTACTPVRSKGVRQVQWIFLHLPAWLRFLPILYSLLFLMGLFDFWVVQVTSGNRINYWGVLLFHRTFQEGNLAAGACMIIIGGTAVAVLYGMASVATAAAIRLIRSLSPMAVARYASIPIHVGNWIFRAGFLCLFGLAIAPLVQFGVRLFSGRNAAPTISLAFGAASAIFRTVEVAGSVGAISAIVGILLGVLITEYRRTVQWTNFAMITLALAPEHCFALVVLSMSTAGLVDCSTLLLCVVMLSYSIPIAALVTRQFLLTTARNEAAPFRAALICHPLQASSLVFTAFKKIWLCLFALLFWLAADDVLLASLASGPGTKPFAAWAYGSVLRGVSRAEERACVYATGSRVVILSAVAVAFSVVSAVRPNNPRRQEIVDDH